MFIFELPFGPRGASAPALLLMSPAVVAIRQANDSVVHVMTGLFHASSCRLSGVKLGSVLYFPRQQARGSRSLGQLAAFCVVERVHPGWQLPAEAVHVVLLIDLAHDLPQP